MRTEEEVLKDFKKLKWKVFRNNNQMLCLLFYNKGSIVQDKEIIVGKKNRLYRTYDYISMQEHKLLTELFTIWGWL